MTPGLKAVVVQRVMTVVDLVDNLSDLEREPSAKAPRRSTP